MYPMNQEFRCQSCHKKLFEGNLALLVKQKYQEPGDKPHIEVLCHRCKTLNRFVYDPAASVLKAVS
jgi:phage FluMu protein Com